MKKKEIITAIKRSNIPTDQKQEIIKRIQYTADPGQIALIFIEALKLGFDVWGKFPPP